MRESDALIWDHIDAVDLTEALQLCVEPTLCGCLINTSCNEHTASRPVSYCGHHVVTHGPLAGTPSDLHYVVSDGETAGTEFVVYFVGSLRIHE